MTVMTPKQEAVLRELILLAKGDSDLVWEAIRKNANERQFAPLEKVVEYIIEHLNTKNKVKEDFEEKYAAAI
jgi:hypothetical protein